MSQYFLSIHTHIGACFDFLYPEKCGPRTILFVHLASAVLNLSRENSGKTDSRALFSGASPLSVAYAFIHFSPISTNCVKEIVHHCSVMPFSDLQTWFFSSLSWRHLDLAFYASFPYCAIGITPKVKHTKRYVFSCHLTEFVRRTNEWLRRGKLKKVAANRPHGWAQPMKKPALVVATFP